MKILILQEYPLESAYVVAYTLSGGGGSINIHGIHYSTIASETTMLANV